MPQLSNFRLSANYHAVIIAYCGSRVTLIVWHLWLFLALEFPIPEGVSSNRKFQTTVRVPLVPFLITLSIVELAIWPLCFHFAHGNKIFLRVLDYSVIISLFALLFIFV